MCTDLIEDLEGDGVDHVLDYDPEHRVGSALSLICSTCGQGLGGLQSRLRRGILRNKKEETRLRQPK
jgi:hypothetical protein